jgi:hypothetical protein
MKNVLMIIPQERFRDEELFATKGELEKLGHKITIASTKTGTSPVSRGGFAQSEFDIKKIDVNTYDAVNAPKSSKLFGQTIGKLLDEN